MRIATLAVVVVLVASAGPARSGGTEGARLHLDLTMADGVRVTGTAPDAKLALVAPYGRLELALSGMARVARSDDQETSRVLMRNGDVLRGVVEDAHLEFTPYRTADPRRIRLRDVLSLRVTPRVVIAGSEHVRWEVSYDHAQGWTTSNRGGRFSVTHIDPAVVNRTGGGPWSTVRITRAIRPHRDLDLRASVSWDSGSSGIAAMHNVRVCLLDADRRVVVEAGHNDAWSGYAGRKFSWIAGTKWESRAGTQPLAGRARIGVVRRDGEVTVTWDGKPLQTCRLETPICFVQVRLDFYAYRGKGVESDFGTVVLERLELVPSAE